MENIDREIIITNEKGKKEKGKILFTFNENGEDFILYELNEKAFAAKIKDEGHLLPIEEDEWKIIEKIYKEYQEMEEND